MKHSITGGVIVAFSGLILALEIYGLKLLQVIEQAKGVAWEQAWRYIEEPEVLVALVITVVVMGYGILLMVRKDKK